MALLYDLATYENALEVAIADAKRRGMEESEEIGFKIRYKIRFEVGLEQGRQQARFEIAQRLIKAGFSLEKVAEITELDINILSNRIKRLKLS